MNRFRRVVPVVAAVTAGVVLAGAAAVAAADRGRPFGPGRFDGRFGRGHWLFGVGIALLLAAIVASLLYLLFARRDRSGGATATAAGPSTTAGPPAGPPPAPAAPPTAAAEAILAERLARSEISPDDYRAAIGALRGEHAVTTTLPTTT